MPTLKKFPFSIYSTWGLHDELGDAVDLSEENARYAFDHVNRWRDQFGVGLDYFHVDGFWFDPKRGYRFFKTPHWPRGFEPLRDDILAAGMKPGLWFSTSAYGVDVPAWAESRCANGHCSFVDGPFAELFEADLFHAAEKWDARLFKFDFADFSSTPERVRRTPAETYALAVERFTSMMGRLRARFPDLHVIAHVGFARNQQHQRTGWPHPVPADPALLEVIDGVFSGDPQSMDIPQSSFARNIDLYQDRAVWKLHQAGYPLSRIEDHGSIMGRTNTACSRGRAGFRRSHIGQLARGGGRDFFYGDPGLLTDADVRGMKAARELFFDAFRRQLTTQFIGAGEPGLAPWHAYLTGGARRGLLYVVNPTFTAQRVTLPIVNLTTARVLFNEGPQKPVAQVSPDHLVLDLGPEQMAVVGLGAYADPAHDLGDGTEFAPPAAIWLVATIIRPTPGWGLEADLPTTLPAASHVLVVARAWDGDPADPAHLLPYIFATQTNKAGETTEPKSHELLSITLTDADGQAIRPVRRVPEVAVWSGMSWVATVFPATPGGRIGITQRFEKTRRITATVYQLA